MESCLKLDSLAQRIENYCHNANAIFLKIDPLTEGSDKLFKILLLKGEVQRGEEVQEIIKNTITLNKTELTVFTKKCPTMTNFCSIVKKLLKFNLR